jgi:HEAT repeat protein
LLWTDANQAVDFLVSNLNLIVENKHFQGGLADILGEIGIGNSKAIRALRQLLLRNSDEETKRIWIECLGKIGIDDSNAIFALTQLFHQSSDETTRAKIAGTLIQLDPSHECAIAFLLEQVLNPDDSYYFYYSFANEILEQAEVDNQIITNLLIQNINNATDESIRLGFVSFLSLHNPKEALPYLQKLLDSSEEKILLEAAQALLDISPNNPKAIQTLKNLLNYPNENLVHATAMVTLVGNINPVLTEAQDALINLLNSEDDEIVFKIANHWREIKVNPVRIANRLLEIVLDSKSEVDRAKAARTLLEIAVDERNVTDRIIALLSLRRDEQMHLIVAWFLREIIPATSEAIRVLIECLSSPIAQSAAAVSLGQAGKGNKDAVSALINLLQGSIDKNLQREVVKSLGKIGFDNLNAIGALENLLNETNDEETFFLAAYILSQSSAGKSKGIEALKKLISFTQSFSLQSQAAMALWQQLPGDINTLETLIELLLDNREKPNSLHLDIDQNMLPFRKLLLTC